MIDHPTFGPSAPELGWVPAPRYLLRRSLVLDRLSREKPSKLLEIGPGAGALLLELSQQGWICAGYESSSSALAIARKLNSRPGQAHLSSEPYSDWEGAYDWIIALEVLEHIEHDHQALADWRRWLSPNGTLLLSVPAHRRKWNYTDVWAGHYRRYERQELVELVSLAGFQILNIANYGFPVSNLIEPIRSLYHRRLLSRASESTRRLTTQKRTSRSGVSRSLESRLFRYYSGVFGTLFMKCAFSMQKRFLSRDLGTGYLVEARRVEADAV